MSQVTNYHVQYRRKTIYLSQRERERERERVVTLVSLRKFSLQQAVLIVLVMQQHTTKFTCIYYTEIGIYFNFFFTIIIAKIYNQKRREEKRREERCLHVQVLPGFFVEVQPQATSLNSLPFYSFPSQSISSYTVLIQ